MKRIASLTALGACLIAIAACQKVDTAKPEKEPLVFTATFAAPSTKTTVDADPSSPTAGEVSWEADDTITIEDKAGNVAVYEIESITEGKAVFIYKSGEELGEGPYSASYGTAPSTEQTYSATPSDLPMAAESATTSLTFSVTCGLLKITLSKAGESIKKISVTGTPTGGTETTYSLSCATAQSIDSAKDFYIALPAGSYTLFKFTDENNLCCTNTAMEGRATVIVNNTIKPISFSSSLAFNESFFTINGGQEQYFFVVGTTWFNYVKAHPNQGFLWSEGISKFLYYNKRLLTYNNSKIKMGVTIVPGANYTTY